MIGGIGRAGGDGEVHSPSSMKVSATTPSKGARSTVLSSWARASATADAARSAAARAARQAAAAVRDWLSTSSIRSVETMPWAASDRVRSSSRAARSAARQAWSRWAAAALRSSSLTPQLRPLQRVVDAQQQVALLDDGAPAAGEREHLAADLGRELGPPPRLHGAGPRVGDGLLDAALLDGHDPHGDALGREER